MFEFLSEDFLLPNEASRILYNGFAKNTPIIDYHCHNDPRAIYEDLHYESITELWLGGDHYKWRAMRWAGVPEREVTGLIRTDPFRVFEAWARTLPRAVGNPLYHWSYLELKRYFGIDAELNPDSAKEIYDAANEALRSDEMGVRGLIRRSGVRLICTTDDPADDLIWHRRLAADSSFDVRVLPAFRPDTAMAVDKPGYADYIKRLSDSAGTAIDSYGDLVAALTARIDYFDGLGCRTSDHGLDYCVYSPAPDSEIERIFKDALASPVTLEDGDKFKTALLMALAGEYKKHGWAMQLHFSCLREISSTMYGSLGSAAGFDAVATENSSRKLSELLDALERRGALPKTILYSLNQHENEAIASIAGAFQTNSEGIARVQPGAAWWFNDNYLGMRKQLQDYASLGVLGSFIGMLTDSRSFLSYTRHEYFRRILCGLLGEWVEKGEVIPNMASLGSIVRDISYSNANRYFGFNLPE